MGAHHIVAAGDAGTAHAAREILSQGGNAFDAGVAAVFAAMVCEPALTSPGGGGFLMAAPQTGSPVLYDFFVDMPSSSPAPELDFFPVDIDFGTARQQFHIGKGAAAVPGNLPGLLRVHQDLGTLPLRQILEPAVRFARDGFTLSPVQAGLIQLLQPILTREEEGRKIFAPGGTLLKAGQKVYMKKFGDFLQSLVESESGQWQGKLAAALNQWATPGTLLREKDFERYRVIKRIPLKTEFCGHTILLNPPPSLGGSLIRLSLRLLSESNQIQPTTWEALALSLELTNEIRDQEPSTGDAGIGNTFEDLSRRSQSVHQLRERLNKLGGGLESSSLGSTTHCSILDRQGNAVGVTTTNGEGCGYLLPGLGFMMNNMLGEEDLNPGGFHRYPPGSRLASMMSPTIVFRENQPVLVTGSAGSNRIRSVIVQILTQVLSNGIAVSKATEAPRIHVEGGVLHAEPGLPEAVLSRLEARFHLKRWPAASFFFGGAHSVTPQAGAGDSRRGGVSLIC